MQNNAWDLTEMKMAAMLFFFSQGRKNTEGNINFYIEEITTSQEEKDKSINYRNKFESYYHFTTWSSSDKYNNIVSKVIYCKFNIK